MGTHVMRMRHTPSVPVVAIAMLVAAALAATVLIVLRTTGVSFDGSAVRPPAATTESAQATAPEWDFVLRSPGAAEILRHRPGLTPVDIVRTHAFGWEGLTIREALDSPKMIEILRHRPGLTPLDLVRIGSPTDTGRAGSE